MEILSFTLRSMLSSVKDLHGEAVRGSLQDPLQLWESLPRGNQEEVGDTPKGVQGHMQGETAREVGYCRACLDSPARHQMGGHYSEEVALNQYNRPGVRPFFCQGDWTRQLVSPVWFSSMQFSRADLHDRKRLHTE